MSSRSPNCHPGLVPGPNEKATEAKDYTQPVIPGLPRDLTKRPQSQSQPPLVAIKIPDMRCAIPGRPTGRHPGLAPGTNKKATKPTTTPKSCHPGLVPGPSGLAPGTNKKATKPITTPKPSSRACPGN